MSATDANRLLLALGAAAAACLLASQRRRAAPSSFCIKRVFISLDDVCFCTWNSSIYVHSNPQLTSDYGEGEGYCGQHACAWADLRARKAGLLVAHDDAMDLNHHPLQRAQGSKQEPIARGPRGGEKRHDEPEGVE